MIILRPSEKTYGQAARVLKDDGVLVYPTDTLYGLGVNPFSVCALKKLWQLKGRSENKPVLVIIGELAQLDQLCLPLSKRARYFIKHFWPGPLSLLLPRKPSVPPELTSGFPKVCVRLPNNEIARNLCRAFGSGITSSSANLSGKPSISCLEEIDFPGIDMGIDGGLLNDSTPSTIFDPDEGKILREGVIPSSILVKHLIAENNT